MEAKIKLTDVEHEIMQILWQLGEGSVNDVMAKLPEERQLAYTSVSTVLRILEQKNIVKTRRDDRKHIYIPLISQGDYQHSALSKLVDTVFSGDPVSVVNYLIDNRELSSSDVDAIKKMLSEKIKESKGN